MLENLYWYIKDNDNLNDLAKLYLVFRTISGIEARIIIKIITIKHNTDFQVGTPIWIIASLVLFIITILYLGDCSYIYKPLHFLYHISRLSSQMLKHLPNRISLSLKACYNNI